MKVWGQAGIGLATDCAAGPGRFIYCFSVNKMVGTKDILLGNNYLVEVIMCENWTFLHANNKGADQPAHPCSLASTCVIHYQESIVVKLAQCKISPFKLVAVPEQTGLLICSWAHCGSN